MLSARLTVRKRLRLETVAQFPSLAVVLVSEVLTPYCWAICSLVFARLPALHKDSGGSKVCR